MTKRRNTRKRIYGGKTLKQVVNAREAGLVKAEISSKKAEAARFSWMRRHGLA
jgi:hypothetical protein